MQVLDTNISSAAENMRLDGELLHQLDPAGAPILHLYGWEEPSVTYGYFIRPEEWFDLQKTEARGVALARRPTGGGITFHIWDLAFSFLLPSNHPACSINTLENYRFVNETVLETVKELFSLPDSVEIIPNDFQEKSSDCGHFCMAKPTQYDVVYQGRKIAGAAQRRRKQGYLHQGTISLALPDKDLLQDILLSQDEVIQAMSQYTFAPLGSIRSQEELFKTRKEIERLLQQKFLEKLHVFS